MSFLISEATHLFRFKPDSVLPSTKDVISFTPITFSPTVEQNATEVVSTFSTVVQNASEAVKFIAQNGTESSAPGLAQTTALDKIINFAASAFEELAKKLPPLLPFILYTLWASKVLNHQTVYVGTLKATKELKKFTFLMGKKPTVFSAGKEIAISFEIQLSNVPKKEPLKYLKNFSSPLVENNSCMSYFFPLNQFEWKREVTKTVYVIDVEHAGISDSIDNFYPVTENETFVIQYKKPDPMLSLTQQIMATEASFIKTLTSQRFNEMSIIGPIKIRDDLYAGETQYSILPLEKNPSKAHHYYTKIIRVS